MRESKILIKTSDDKPRYQNKTGEFRKILNYRYYEPYNCTHFSI